MGTIIAFGPRASGDVATAVTEPTAPVVEPASGTQQNAGARRQRGTSERRSYQSGGFTYSYRVFTPRGVKPGAPMVVMVHGCGTTLRQVERAHAMNTIARRAGFIVLYVDGSVVNASTQKCWRGLTAPLGESRSTGDAAAIAGMTRRVTRHHRVDSKRIYAVGMSSGGFETSILAGLFPDIYAAVGIHAGAAYKHGAAGCFSLSDYIPQAGEVPGGPLPTTNQLASLAHAEQGSNARVVPVIVFHGDQDGTIPVDCGRQALEQWRRTNNLATADADTRTRPIPSQPSSTHTGKAARSRGYSYTLHSWASPSGTCTVMQMWTVHGLGHFWSGGTADPRYATWTDPRGPNASAAAWRFFAPIRRTELGFTCRQP